MKERLMSYLCRQNQIFLQMKKNRMMTTLWKVFPDIPPIRFYGRKVFHTLPEAADEIENYEGEIDVILVPPEPDILTDEEEQDDDNIMESQIPNDVPGFVEVGLGNSIKWCDSDDEPLSSFANKCPRIDEKKS
ncbi:hypothetical protein QE152_g5029 [Popillia japonica]|uniref:Uncharacterized protein n=1 Tax=Popillia japonica TaxID=7064 RepID=A0AAW1MY82_POPJA